MWPLFSHLCHITWWTAELVFHWTYFNFLIHRSLCHKIFLIQFTNWKGSHEGRDFRFIFSFITIKIEIFSLFLMILISFLFIFKSTFFFIYLSFGKNTRFHINLLWLIKPIFDSIIFLFISFRLIKIVFLIGVIH